MKESTRRALEDQRTRGKRSGKNKWIDKAGDNEGPCDYRGCRGRIYIYVGTSLYTRIRTKDQRSGQNRDLTGHQKQKDHFSSFFSSSSMMTTKKNSVMTLIYAGRAYLYQPDP